MEKYSEAFAEIEAVCRKYNMAGAVILSDGNNVHSCYGLDWSTWSRVKSKGVIGKQSIGVPHVFTGRKDCEDYLQTANLIHSVGDASKSLFEACAQFNHFTAVAMKKAIDAEKQQNHART